MRQPQGTFDALGRLPRIAVLGASRIVPKALLEPAQGIAPVRGVAARELSRAAEFAGAHGLNRAYGSYDEALNDPRVDAIYVATPASEHARWVVEALQAGKHVLCEKPFGLSVTEALDAVAQAEWARRLLVEAHHSWFHPLRAPFQVAVAGLGRLERLEAVFRAPVRDETNIRLRPELGAGVFLDFGGYPLCWIEWARAAAAMPESPDLAGGDFAQWRVLSAEADCRPDHIDWTMTAHLECTLGGARLPATVTCSMEPYLEFEALIEVVGERGRVVFVNPLSLAGSLLRFEREGEPTLVTAPANETTYLRQLRSFVRAVETGAEAPHSGSEIVELQRLTDRVYAASGLASRAELARGPR